MNEKRRQIIMGIVKQVAFRCHLYRTEKMSLEQWRECMVYALEETRRLITVGEVPTEEQRKDSQIALCSWAKDVWTQDWIQMHPDVHIDRKTQWRKVSEENCTPGEINALKKFRGIPRITNGVFVYCERGDGTVFKGHMDWFVKDEKAKGRKAERESKKAEELKARMAEYF